MFCPNCGTENDTNTKFCTKCGTMLNPDTTQTTATDYLKQGLSGAKQVASSAGKLIKNSAGNIIQSASQGTSQRQTPVTPPAAGFIPQDTPLDNQNQPTSGSYNSSSTGASIPSQSSQTDAVNTDTQAPSTINYAATPQPASNSKKKMNSAPLVAMVVGILIFALVMAILNPDEKSKSSGKSSEKQTATKETSEPKEPTIPPAEESNVAPTDKPTEAPTATPTATPTKPDTTATEDDLFYTSNNSDTVGNGNKGQYAYCKKGNNYDQYYIIDFDAGYVYSFNEGEGNTDGERLKIDSGDLKSDVIITYHIDGNFSYQLHFKSKNDASKLEMVDNNGFKNDYAATDLNKALQLWGGKNVTDY